MQCRAGCGACCIAPSISSPIPQMPAGKPAGTACVHLDANFLCGLFESAERPEVCIRFQATEELCGDTRDEALIRLAWLEQATR
jgi:Fe-S-cluster containining protein